MNDDSWFLTVALPNAKKGGDDYSDQDYMENGFRKWKSKDGRETPLEEMGSDHIHACIEKIKRANSNWRKEWLEFFNMELAFRNEVHSILQLSSGVRITPAIRKAYFHRRGLSLRANTEYELPAWDSSVYQRPFYGTTPVSFGTRTRGTRTYRLLEGSGPEVQRAQKEEAFPMMYGGRGRAFQDALDTTGFVLQQCLADKIKEAMEKRIREAVKQAVINGSG